MDINELERKSIQYRRQILEIIQSAQAGHVGGSLSCIDIINVLYNHVMEVTPASFKQRIHDRYVQSKGHSVQALYVVLADKGFFPYYKLVAEERFGTPFIGHPTREVPGIEINTGALGHGLSVAVGMALAAKMDNLPVRVFTLLGDGELAEGSVWEASMCACHHHLDNLTVIIDRNTLQITGSTEDVMRLEPLEEKLKSFGYATRNAGGNCITELIQAFEDLPFEVGKPSLLIAHTVKGKGVSFMENQPGWHHRVPTAEEFAAARRELDVVEKNWKKTHAELRT